MSTETQTRPSHRQPRIFAWGLLIFGLALLTAVFSPRCDLLSRPLKVADNLHEADVIVAFSAGKLDHCQAHPNLFLREAYAAQLLREYYSTSGKLIISGIYTRQGPAALAQCRVKLARQFGITPQQLLIDNTANTTYENALHTHALMARNHWHSVILVTFSSHMYRALRTLKKQDAHSIVVYPVQVPDPPPYGNEWFSANRLEHLKRFLYEYGALMKYTWYGYL